MLEQVSKFLQVMAERGRQWLSNYVEADIPQVQIVTMESLKLEADLAKIFHPFRLRPAAMFSNYFECIAIESKKEHLNDCRILYGNKAVPKKDHNQFLRASFVHEYTHAYFHRSLAFNNALAPSNNFIIHDYFAYSFELVSLPVKIRTKYFTLADEATRVLKLDQADIDAFFDYEKLIGLRSDGWLPLFAVPAYRHFQRDPKGIFNAFLRERENWRPTQY